MKYATTLLWINAACFLLFGAAFLIAPGPMAHLLAGATPSTANALIDIRATYGGMALGIGIFFAWWSAACRTAARAGGWTTPFLPEPALPMRPRTQCRLALWRSRCWRRHT